MEYIGILFVIVLVFLFLKARRRRDADLRDRLNAMRYGRG